MIEEVLTYFPLEIRNKINRFNLEFLEEIRIRNSKPIFLKIGQEEVKVDWISKTEDILEILQRVCDNSIYTYQNQICNGYITIKGGHRVFPISIAWILELQDKF